jgi:hypothetical protein
MRCIICDEERPESEEHIFPLAIGGCLATLRVCSDCNSKLGARVDAPLVDHLAIVLRREELKIAGRARVPSSFDRVLGGRSVLGGVDGFDQDKHAGEGDEGGEVLGGLLAA